MAFRRGCAHDAADHRQESPSPAECGGARGRGCGRPGTSARRSARVCVTAAKSASGRAPSCWRTPTAAAVLTARSQRLGGVLGDVLAAADGAARIPEQGIGRVGHEAPAHRVQPRRSSSARSTAPRATQARWGAAGPAWRPRASQAAPCERAGHALRGEPVDPIALAAGAGMQVDLRRRNARVTEQRLGHVKAAHRHHRRRGRVAQHVRRDAPLQLRASRRRCEELASTRCATNETGD